jgi:energy-converting hydrogenase A subunit R
MEHAKEAIQHIAHIMPCYIVSTSYQQYINALCNLVDFFVENTYSTKLDLDKHDFSQREITRLRELSKQIAKLPVIEIPEGAEKIEDLSFEMRKTLEKLDEIFFSELPKMAARWLLEEVCPVGSKQKADAVIEIGKKLGVSLKDFIYVGDSITDVEAFKIVREAGGLTISFNGNQYAVREADVAVLSRSAMITAFIAEAFARLCRRDVLRMVENWRPEKEVDLIDSKIGKLIFSQKELPKVKRVTSENLEQLIDESSTFRRTVRGYAVGSLG